MVMLALLGLLAVAGLLVWVTDRAQTANRYEVLKPKLDRLERDTRELQSEREQLDRRRFHVESELTAKQVLWSETQKRREARLEEDRKLEQASWEAVKQRQAEQLEAHARVLKDGIGLLSSGKAAVFPWIADACAELLYLSDLRTAEYLDTKQNPAHSTAAEIRRDIAVKRRECERAMRIYKYQLAIYEGMFPWLTEFKEIDDELLQVNEDREDESVDPIEHYLAPGESSSLSREEKSQLALDRYWTSRKTRWQVGRDYERYVGYLYEKDGWQVTYHGIAEGLSDLGRDLIVRKGDRTMIVQCKCWAQHKRIHEKHIFQLFGTTIEYWITVLGSGVHVQQPSFEHLLSQNPVEAVLVTSTSLSDEARKFAKVLGVDFREDTQLERYPSIKCNASGIYHLPLDQQYDRTKIQDPRTEKYVSTIKEAEGLGYRRAFRWRGRSGTGA